MNCAMITNLLGHLDTVWLLHESESIFCYSRLEGDEFAVKEAICPGTKSLIMFLVSERRRGADTGGGKRWPVARCENCEM